MSWRSGNAIRIRFEELKIAASFFFRAFSVRMLDCNSTEIYCSDV